MVSARTGCPSVSIQRLNKGASLIINVYLSVAIRTCDSADPADERHFACCWHVRQSRKQKQPTKNKNKNQSKIKHTKKKERNKSKHSRSTGRMLLRSLSRFDVKQNQTLPACVEICDILTPKEMLPTETDLSQNTCKISVQHFEKFTFFLSSQMCC